MMKDGPPKCNKFSDVCSVVSLPSVCVVLNNLLILVISVLYLHV